MDQAEITLGLGLEQCLGAIEWVRGRREQTFSSLPVGYAFTPGTFDERVSHVILLRRNGEGSEPYLWCVVQFRNFRFQVCGPFCPADASWFGKADAPPPTFEHYPSMAPPDWSPGPTEFQWLDRIGQITYGAVGTMFHGKFPPTSQKLSLSDRFQDWLI